MIDVATILEKEINFYDLDSEIKLIGSIFLTPHIIFETSLSDCDFNGVENRLIFFSMCHLRDKGHPVDLVTVTENLVDRGLLESAGGVDYISKSVNEIYTSNEWRSYESVIQKKAKMRLLLKKMQGMEKEIRYLDQTD
jgi:replicative DNA helicase